MAVIPSQSPLLVRECLEHLHEEYTALDRLNISLRAVRDALSRHDSEQLPALLEQQQQQMSHVADVRKARSQLRCDLAADLDQSENEVTVSDWAAQLDADDRDRVICMKNQLAEIAEESAQLAQSNMAVVAYGMQLLDEVMGCLTGQPRSQRYAASGAPCPAPNTSLIEVRH